jgi:hypothetical protein
MRFEHQFDKGKYAVELALVPDDPDKDILVRITYERPGVQSFVIQFYLTNTDGIYVPYGFSKNGPVEGPMPPRMSAESLQRCLVHFLRENRITAGGASVTVPIPQLDPHLVVSTPLS